MTKTRLGLEELISVVLPPMIVVIIAVLSFFLVFEFQYDANLFVMFGRFIEQLTFQKEMSYVSVTISILFGLSILYMVGSFVDTVSHYAIVPASKIRWLDLKGVNFGWLRYSIRKIMFGHLMAAYQQVVASGRDVKFSDLFCSEQEKQTFYENFRSHIGFDPKADIEENGVYWRVYFLLLKSNDGLFAKTEVYHAKRKLYLNMTTCLIFSFMLVAGFMLIGVAILSSYKFLVSMFALLAIVYTLTFVVYKEYLEIRFISFQYAIYSMLALGLAKAP